MKITFEMNEPELNAVVQEEVRKEVQKFFTSKKDNFIKEAVDRNTKGLVSGGFFNRQVSSALNKAIYDKVNREFASMIEAKVEREVDKIVSQIKTPEALNERINELVKEKLEFLMGKF